MEIALLILSSLSLFISLVVLTVVVVTTAKSKPKKEIVDPIERQLKSVEESTYRLFSQGLSMLQSVMKDGQEHSSSLLDAKLGSLDKQMSTIDLRQANLTDALLAQLKNIQEGNEKQLTQMREIVDEKLTATIESRLSQSFSFVNATLEKVNNELSEMKQLTGKVQDLNKILSNVKSRGIMGEVSLAALLEEIFTPDQYKVNVSTGDTRENVEFAVIMPGRGDDRVLLPIDCKFPLADYERYIDSMNSGDKASADLHYAGLIKRVKEEAKDICAKYINPPVTTDFAVLYLPVEGLFAEVVRNSGLLAELQHEHHIMVAGPTTLYALLNSLQVGFRTLAIEQKSREIWELLGVFKKQFRSFNVLIEKTCKQLETVSNTMQKAKRSTATIDKKLRTVEMLPDSTILEDIIDVGEEVVADDTDSDTDQ